ncbi:MAG: hypothetical protein A3G34_11885 [Candidatus Lindowbacteria bacterium RIFCSPLOWO2_12_FULL_62_27]|nr:MAG: hypothetical protein A3G34_11885 [Candidatus Lindowbacteria bacterium RIFCSPLOWO2_12_FULL_62_27]OGH63892.1 MAG: hypothetical protein A3I06_02040 [Candidatus Lindowbacteria bacterium RIFCSPLOWO2_02_FULL_62_12]
MTGRFCAAFALMILIWSPAVVAESYEPVEFKEPPPAEWAKFLPSGHLLVSTAPATFDIMDPESGQVLSRWTITDEGRPLGAEERVIAVSPDGRQVVTRSGQETKLRTWSRGKLLGTLDRADPDAPVVFSPDGRFLAAPSGGDRVLLMGAATGETIRTFQADRKGVITAMEFSADGARLAAGIVTGSVTIWDAVTGARLRTVHHRGWVRDLAFFPTGRKLAAGSGLSIRLIDPDTSAPARTLGKRENDRLNVRSLAFDATGVRLASGIGGTALSRPTVSRGWIEMWDARRGILLQTIPCAGPVDWVEFSPDGRHLAAIDLLERRTLKLWRINLDQPPSSHPDSTPLMYAEFYESEALRLLAQRRYTESEHTFLLALDIKQRVLGPDHPAVASLMETVSNLYVKMNRLIEAEVYMEQAVKIRAQTAAAR